MTINTELEENNLPFLIGGGEMGKLIRSIDWRKTPLNTPQNWPLCLKHAVATMLSSTFPMMICWGDDFIQLYNDAYRPINGVNKHPRAMGAPAAETYNEIWPSVKPMFKRVCEGESIGFTNLRVPLYRNAYEEEGYFNFSYTPIRDENGDIGGVLVICIETTEYVQSTQELTTLNEELAAANEEQAAANEEYAVINEELASTNEELIQTQYELQQSESLFRTIALNIPKSIIMVLDRDRRFLMIEGDGMQKLGYNGIDFKGKHPTEVVSPERYEDTKHLYDRMYAGEKFSVERASDVSGETYMVHFVPLKNDEDDVEGGLIIALEITEFKIAEEKSAKLAAIIETSEDAIVSKTLDSVITSWNKSAERMFGYSAEEIIGESIYTLIPEDRLEEEPQIIGRLSRGERVEHFETKRRTKSGKLIDVSLSISPLKDRNGKIVGISKIARDITFKKLEEQRKNDFVAMVSHELKTPLTTIHSYVQLLLAKSLKEGDDFHIKALSRTEVQTKRMTAMINDFLSVARLEVGEMSIHKKDFDLESLANEIILDVEFLTTRHHIQLVGCESIHVHGDRDKIGQVLNNLLTNAIKYDPKGGPIILGCEKNNDKVRIFVQDQGVGIKEESQKRLFERFYRAENDELKMVSGFGIGLYLVSEILRHHGSQIELQSKENEGSTFSFSLDLVSS